MQAADPMAQVVATVDGMKVMLETAMADVDVYAKGVSQLPRETQLHHVKAVRSALAPLLDSLRAVLEPVATADMKLHAIQRQLERK